MMRPCGKQNLCIISVFLTQFHILALFSHGYHVYTLKFIAQQFLTWPKLGSKILAQICPLIFFRISTEYFRSIIRVTFNHFFKKTFLNLSFNLCGTIYSFKSLSTKMPSNKVKRKIVSPWTEEDMERAVMLKKQLIRLFVQLLKRYVNLIFIRTIFEVTFLYFKNFLIFS